MGQIYLYYGTGGGKTANALGLALRSVGHDHKVVIVQFMKWWTETGEYKIMQRLRPNYEIYLFGKPGWINFARGKRKVQSGGISLIVRDPEEYDTVAIREGLEFSRKILIDVKPDLLILDEICLAVHTGLISVNEVLKVLENIPENTDVILTGRYASKELLERADYVNEIIERKAPKELVAKPGIQY